MKCEVCVDWLTFSVKKEDPNEVIRDYLGLDPALFQDTGYSLLGYNKVLQPIVRICLDDTKRELPEDYNFTEYLVTEEKGAVLLTLSTEEFDLESKPM